MAQSYVVESKLPCPSDKCSSSDAFMLYDDGHGYCYSCGHFEPPDGDEDEVKNFKKRHEEQVKAGLILDGFYEPVGRMITMETCKYFGYQQGTYEGVNKKTGETFRVPCQFMPVYDAETSTRLVSQKVRMADKRFAATGDLDKGGLLGQHLWKPGGKRLVITEGEFDMLAYAQVSGLGWETCSLPNGVLSTEKAFRRNIAFINSFEEVILMFDMDDQGQEAAIVAAELLTPGKARIARLPLKDACDMLVAGRVKELREAVYNAKPYRPDGIIMGSEMDLAHIMRVRPRGTPYPYPVLDDMVHGARPGEVVTFTAGSGVGKSTLTKEIMHHMVTECDLKVGVIPLEEATDLFAQSLIAIDNNIPKIDLQENPDLLTYDQQLASYDRIVAPVAFYDSWGSTEVENILSRIHYMAVGLQRDLVILDHISMVVSGQDTDERKALDMLMTEMRKLVENTGIRLFIICHLGRKQGKNFNEGSQISLSDLRGSAGVEQLSDIVIADERNQQGDDPDVHQLRVLKNRPIGKLGDAGNAKYHVDIGRLLPYTPLESESDTTGLNNDQKKIAKELQEGIKF